MNTNWEKLYKLILSVKTLKDDDEDTARSKRIFVCIEACKAIENEDIELREKFFRHFVEAAEDIWFDSGESADYSIFESGNKPTKSNIVQEDIDTEQNKEKFNKYSWRYGNLVKGLIDVFSDSGDSEECFYGKLWDAIASVTANASLAEKGVCIYLVVDDLRIPYYSLPQGLMMTSEEIVNTYDEIASHTNKIEFAFNVGYTQRTELASRALYILDQLETNTQKAVLLTDFMYHFEKQLNECDECS